MAIVRLPLSQVFGGEAERVVLPYWWRRASFK